MSLEALRRELESVDLDILRRVAERQRIARGIEEIKVLGETYVGEVGISTRRSVNTVRGAAGRSLPEAAIIVATTR